MDEGVPLTQDELVSRFTIVDYVIFSLMLALSAGIGIFYGCFGKKMQNTKDFLMAGRSMTTFPVAMSLIASFMSAITLLGTPSEVYQNGFTYWLIGFSYFLVMPSAAYLYFPVFWKMQVTSAYEYLEHRFNSKVRKLGSLVFIIQMSLYMAIVVYAPALALAQVTGMNVYVSVSVICFVCIFYTTLGGMKAVLWTDALQVVIMYTTMVLIIIKGAYDQGGFMAVWEAGTRGNRTLIVDWDVNPTTRHTFWSLFIGGYFTWITIYGNNQAQVQRYMCVKKRYMATRALWINMVGLFILMIVCAFGGLVIYAKYENCDPVGSGIVSKNDQLLPLYVLDTLGHLQGLPGLFVAGIFSGALSTVSSGMNSLAAITLEDFVKGGCAPNISEQTATKVSKGLSLFFGILTFALVFVAEQLGNVLSAALSIFGMVGGPLCGVFTLGMFCPWANSVGAFVGTIAGLCFTFWIGVGYQIEKALGHIPLNPLPTSTAGCVGYNITGALNSSMSGILNISASDVSLLLDQPIEAPPDSWLLDLYQVSYMWYSAIGCLSVIFVGLIVSLITGLQDLKTLNPDTLSPLTTWVASFTQAGRDIGLHFIDEKSLEKVRDDNSTLPMGQTNLAFSTNSDNGYVRERNGEKVFHVSEESSRL